MKRSGPEPTVVMDANERLSKIINTPTEERFERLTRMARALFDVPVAIISFLDENVQWFKSCAGLKMESSTRSESFCDTVVTENDVIVVEDARKDPRFKDMMLVKGSEKIVFYAGAPIITPEGDCIGAFAIKDRTRRTFTQRDITTLQGLARQVGEALWGAEAVSSLPDAGKEQSDIETFFALRQILPLDILSDDELMLVVRFAKSRYYPPKSLIAADDTPTNRLYILLEGAMVNEEGMELHPIAGAVSLALNTPPAYAIYAGPEGARCLTLLRAQYLALINLCPKLMRSIIRMITFGNR